MSCYRFAAVLLSVIFAIGFAKGEIVEINSEDETAPDRVRFDFAGKPRCGSAQDLFRNWGIKIGSDGGFAPVVDQIIIFGFPSSFLRNGSCEEAPAGGDASPLLVFDFQYPVTEAAFNLSNGGDGVTAELKAYDGAGRTLGTLVSPEVAGGDGVYFGVKTVNGASISKVTIAYSTSELEEHVIDFSFAYATRPSFSNYLPQIGDAVFPGGALRTIIVVTNLTDSTADGQVALFSQQGDELDLELAGGPDTARATQGDMANSFSIPPGGSAVLSTPGDSEQVVQGYAIVDSSVPIQTAAVFQILDAGGAPFLEAGIAGARPATFQSATVGRAPLGAIDAGVAVANTSDTAATVDMQLVNTKNEVFGVFQAVMEPGTHMASFVPGLFPNAPPTLDGAILIRSDVPVVATVIRTLSGLVSASLQVAQ